MLRLVLAAMASLVVGLLLVAIAFGSAWSGPAGGNPMAQMLALGMAGLLSAGVIATATLPRARAVVVAVPLALPMFGFAWWMQSLAMQGGVAAFAAAAALAAWLGPIVTGRLPWPGTAHE